MFLNNFAKGFIEARPLLMVVFLGIVGFFAPIASIFVTGIKGQQIFVQFNSSMLMVLSLLVIVFFVIKSFDFFFNRNPKLFIISIITLLLIIISFMFNLVVFVSI
jgi:glucan phosphoethanolaminetransferase (alkaline phosphatase superfamily)